PGRVPQDQVEAAPAPGARGEDVTEMGLECEKRRTTLRDEPAERSAERAPACSQAAEQSPFGAIESAPAAEQVAVARAGEQRREPGVDPADGVLEEGARQRGFSPCQLGERLALGGSGQAEERAARRPQPLELHAAAALPTAARERARQGQRIEQRVALAYVAVEVRQGGDALQVGLLVVGDEGEPEPELRQPYGLSFRVDPEQGMREHVASHGDAGSVARRLA